MLRDSARGLRAPSVRLVLLSLALPGLAHADAPLPHPTVVPSPARAVAPHHEATIIYLNRCDDGCVIQPGYDDSLHHTSTLVRGTVDMPPFPHSDEVWRQVVDCARFVYAPYGITVTDQDPGATPHFENIVSGDPGDIGMPSDVGGVGVGAAGYVVDNAISFTFAHAWPADPRLLCYVVAQETAHCFGLDHELLAADPMTYLPYDGTHLFQDMDAPCGEKDPRTCWSGASSQNSHQYLLSQFGPGTEVNPAVDIVRPADGAEVPPGFAIQVSAGVYVETARVEVDGTEIANTEQKPFVFNAPADLDEGTIEVAVELTDLRGNKGQKTITVHVTKGEGGGGEPGDEGDGASDGCQTSGGTASAAGLSLVLAALLRWRRRRA